MTKITISVIPTGGTTPITLEDLAAAVLVQTGTEITPDGHLVLGTLGGSIDLGVLPGFIPPTPTPGITISAIVDNLKFGFNGISVSGVKATGDDTDILEAYVDESGTALTGSGSATADGNYTLVFTYNLSGNVGDHTIVLKGSNSGVASDPFAFSRSPYISFVGVTRIDANNILVAYAKHTLDDTEGFVVQVDGNTIYTTALGISDTSPGGTTIVPYNVLDGAHILVLTTTITDVTASATFTDPLPYSVFSSVTRIDSSNIAVVGVKGSTNANDTIGVSDGVSLSYQSSSEPDGPFSLTVPYAAVTGSHTITVGCYQLGAPANATTSASSLTLIDP